MKLYNYFRSSASFRVRIALNIKGLPYEYLPVHLLRGEHRDPAYANLVGDALVPALVTDEGAVLPQSMAIMEYLEELQPTPALLPTTPLARARVRALAQMVACEIHPLNNPRVLKYLTGTLHADEDAKNAWYHHWVRQGLEAFERQLALLAARQLQIPVVSGYHTNFQQYLDHYGLGLLERLLMHYLRCFHERCQATLVPSPCQHTELTRRGFHNLHLLGRGVDAQLFHPARRCHSLRQQWGVAEDELVVLYVGRLAAEKNLALLGRTFASLQQHAGQGRLRLVVVGDGPQAGQWRRQWPQAVFCGVKQGEELARHYASADLFVFPSLSETFGNVVLEALASGLAVIAYDQAAAAQYIRHGYNGVLAMPGDERGFIEAAGWLLDDGESRRRMRLNARREASQCGWPQIVEQFEALLRQATQNTLNTRQVAQRPAAGTLSRATSAPRD